MPKRPIQPQDKYVIRMPDGLRERIKTYADRNGRSMNAEIIRVLEREFPEPLPLDRQIESLIDLVQLLRDGSARESVEKLSNEIHETLSGIATGRLTGVDETTRNRIRRKTLEWEVQQQAYQPKYDDPKEVAESLAEIPEEYD